MKMKWTVNNLENYISVILIITGAIVVVVNIVTEVLKKFTEKYISTNVIVLALSEVLTLAAFLAWCCIKNVAMQWYYIFAAVVLGFFVAYAAMFGFDKLKQALQQFKDAR